MRKPVIAIYNCAQKDLYSVCRTGWKNYVKNLTAFTSKKALYKAATATIALAAVDVAEALPDENARAEDSRTLHVKLEKDGKACTDNFQLTKSYINTAYEPDVRKIKYDDAGQSYFADAAKGDWESVSNLNVSMIGFLSDHTSELEANENMPSTFKAEVNDDKDTFKITYDDFKEAEETGVAADAKVTANKACYTTLANMFKDGQLYFKDKPQYDLFVFVSLLDMINPAVASFDGKVTEIDFTPIGGVNITASTAGKPPATVMSDDDGSFDFGTMAAGVYNVVLHKDGYKDGKDIITIVTGTRFKKDYVMGRV